MVLQADVGARRRTPDRRRIGRRVGCTDRSRTAGRPARTQPLRHGPRARAAASLRRGARSVSAQHGAAGRPQRADAASARRGAHAGALGSTRSRRGRVRRGGRSDFRSSPGSDRTRQAALRANDAPQALRTLERTPGAEASARAQFVLARALRALGRSIEARQAGERAVALEPGTEAYRRWLGAAGAEPTSPGLDSAGVARP